MLLDEVILFIDLDKASYYHNEIITKILCSLVHYLVKKSWKKCEL